MKNKRTTIYYVFAVFIILILFIAINYYHTHKQSENILNPVGKIEDMIPPDDAALTSHDTISKADSNIQDYPERILIKNKQVLADTSLPSYGYRTLEAYLTQYFDYYWDNDTNYYAEVIEDSYVDNYNYPSFNLYVEEIDLEIRCVWYVSRQVYHFYSRFNPE